jgi:hypothetical protein
VAQDPEESGFGARGFRQQGKLTSWIRDPQNPEGDVAAWDPGSEWSTGGASVKRHHIRRFPDKEIPDKNEVIDL